jgi:hypothetical protein
MINSPVKHYFYWNFLGPVDGNGLRRKSLEMGEWWDGWDSNYRINYLFSRLFYRAVRIDAPANAPSKYRLPLDITEPHVRAGNSA